MKTLRLLHLSGLLLLFGLTACLSQGDKTVHPQFDFHPLRDGDVAQLSAGDFSTVIARDRNAPGANPATAGSAANGGQAAAARDPVYCVSPSPDYATALAVARSLNVSATLPKGISGSVAGSDSATETLTQMAGRTAGVVALRDALYNACLAYQNGQIGRTAYALILSQYGNILVELVGASAPGGGNGGGGAAGPDPRLALAEQAHVQALVVACLNRYDPSLRANGDADDDPLLSKTMCRTLLCTIVSATPKLLGVPDAAPASAPAAGAAGETDADAIQRCAAQASNVPPPPVPPDPKAALPPRSDQRPGAPS